MANNTTTAEDMLSFVNIIKHPGVAQKYINTMLMQSPSYQGSMLQVLLENTGKYVECEFLIGTQNMVTKAGILFFVGFSYIILFEVKEKKYIVCDFYSLKFTTFYENENIPVPLPANYQNPLDLEY